MNRIARDTPTHYNTHSYKNQLADM